MTIGRDVRRFTQPALVFGALALLSTVAMAGTDTSVQGGSEGESAGRYYDFVTDPALCALDDFERQEMGMSFDGFFFFEIEYSCTLKTALVFDWTVDQTQVEVGYCQEPGALFPGTFVFQTYAQDPGVLNVWMDDSGAPTVFHLCTR